MPNNDNYEYMRFLDLTGVQQIWDTAKQTFVQTVNGQGIDANGNVNVSSVLTTDEGNFVKSEYNKTLNLCNCNQITITSGASSASNLSISLVDGHIRLNGSTGGDYVYVDIATYSFNGTYYISGDVANCKVFVNSSSAGYPHNQSFTLTANEAIKLEIAPNSSFSNVDVYPMLNIGTTTLPYQAYNGTIVHQKDIKPVLLWENATPSASFSEQDVELSQSLNVGDNICIVWNQGQTGCASYISFLKIETIGTDQTIAGCFTNAYYSGMYALSRLIRIKVANKIHFFSAYSNNSSDNSSAIPRCIYKLNSNY